MGINLSESEWCRKATPEVLCRTQGFSHCLIDIGESATRSPSEGARADKR